MVAAKSVAAESVVEIPVLTPRLLNPRTSLSVLSDRLRPEALYSGRGAARRWRLRHGVKHVVEQKFTKPRFIGGRQTEEFGV